MEHYSRYQVLPNELQPLWFSGCPISIQTIRLTKDLLFDQVLLQLLVQNVTDQPIKSVCLHLLCYDASGILIQNQPSWTLKNVRTAPHGSFSNPTPLQLPPRTTQVTVTPEQVIFFDGQIWTRPDYLEGKRLPPPTPLSPADPYVAQMEQDAQHANIPARFYYEEHNDFWYCCCGQPNPIAATSCGRCCAQQSWLQARMIQRQPPQPRSPFPDLSEYFGRQPGSYQPMLATPPANSTVSTTVPAAAPAAAAATAVWAPSEPEDLLEDLPDTPDLPSTHSAKAGWIALAVFLLAAALLAGFFFLWPHISQATQTDTTTPPPQNSVVSEKEKYSSSSSTEPTARRAEKSLDKSSICGMIYP